MLKLYKLIDNQFHYWETWDEDANSAIVHWGVVGQTGFNKVIKSETLSDFTKVVQAEIDEKLKEGYKEFDEANMASLEIEYKIDGFGTDQDLDKRHKLEERLNELLGWTGLGELDGGSIGSGAMEAGFTVVDFDIAQKVIEQDLKNTEFGDYSRIYRMDD
ncbi:MAG: hypothetical protein HY842_08915 [Bacteroidetes bacterium]|nr:hypothetical protein [Bacteroidota bacterium]